MNLATNFTLSHTHNDCGRTLFVSGRIVATIVAAAVILTPIVFLIFKCFFHRSNRSPADDVNPGVPSIDEELGCIPVVVNGKSTLRGSPEPSRSDDDSLELDETCAICLEGYELGDTVRVLPRCKHVFHKNCIEEWLRVPSLLCPICRDQILEHHLQSTRSDCRNQRDGIAYNLFPLAFSASYPSVLNHFR